MSHLLAYCAGRGEKGKAGATVTKVRDPRQSMGDAKDVRSLTPLQASGMTYVDVVVNGKRVRALYDTGSNCTIVSEALARALGLAA